MTVAWSWVGAVTPTSARLVAYITAGDAATLRVSTQSDLSSPDEFGPEAVDADGFARFDISGLSPATSYHYGLEVDGELDASTLGTFRSFPDGPSNLTIAHGSCQHYPLDGPTWAAITARNPDVFIQCGDMHYSDLDENDEATFLDRYDRVMSKPLWLAMHRALPSVYVWDDHDYGGDASDASSAAAPAAQSAYRKAVPHYPLSDEQGIWHSFTIGRLRVVMLDSRSGREPGVTMLGAAQKAWLKDEMLDAKNDSQVVCLVSPQSWHSNGSDGWRTFTSERQEIIDHIHDHEIDVFLLTGDVHAVAIDDGRNTAGGLREFMAAPLQQFASGVTNNGTWSHGGRLTNGIEHPNTARQYGLTEITDDGQLMTVTWSGYNVSDEGEETLLTSLTFTIGDWLPAQAKMWDGSQWVPVMVKMWDGSAWVPAATKMLAAPG